jgi:hypothetical protein
VGKSFKYLVNCVGCSSSPTWVRYLNAMIDTSTEISTRTFQKHCDYEDIERQLGYGRDIGLWLSTDWHVGFYKSTFGGLPVYYFVHSAIEYIFTPGGEAPAELGRGNRRRRRRGRSATMTLKEALKAFKKLGGDAIIDTTPEGLQRAYRALALQLHPDRRPDGEKARATKEMARLNAAYAVISKTVVDQLKGRSQTEGDVYKGFDWRAWENRAAENMRESELDGDEILRRWCPDRQAGDVSLSDLHQWAAETVAQGFVRVQTRMYTPDDPRLSLYYTPGEFDEKGYHGGVEKTRTLRGKNPKPDKLVAAVLQAISTSLAQVGQSDQWGQRDWQGDPVDLIYKLTLAPGHAAVAWTTPQSWDAAEFAQGSRRSTRWVSLSVHPRPPKTVKSKEKWDVDMVQEYLRRSGLTPFRVGKWSRRDGSRSDFLILSRRTIKPGDSYMGRGQVYFGKLTRDELDRMIIDVGGTPAAEAPKPTPPPPPVPDGQWIRVEAGRRRHPGMPMEWYEAVVNGYHLAVEPGYSGSWFGFAYGDVEMPKIRAEHSRSRFTPSRSPRQEVQDRAAAWARAQTPGNAPLLKRKKRR